jgi:hypoxanthine phosphoribosyltransferase
MTFTAQQIKEMTARAICLCNSIQIEDALNKMALHITQELSDKDPLFLCVMNGAMIPMGQLLTKLHFPLQIDYIHATRYHGKTTGGEITWVAKPRISLQNRYVVIVEDILDTGLTFAAIVEHCRQEGATQVYTATMVDKNHPRSPGGIQRTDFTGLYLPNKFLIGYGLDYEEYFRNLPGIYVLADEDLP